MSYSGEEIKKFPFHFFCKNRTKHISHTTGYAHDSRPICIFYTIIMKGTVSQIYHLGSSLYFMLSRKERLTKIKRSQILI